jgi:major membrane immunogen (membrane-anchored lipoprotein)
MSCSLTLMVEGEPKSGHESIDGAPKPKSVQSQITFKDGNLCHRDYYYTRKPSGVRSDAARCFKRVLQMRHMGLIM